MNARKTMLIIILLVMCGSLLGGCGTTVSRSDVGVVGGALAGGAIGGAVGHTGGAIIGGAAGAYIGKKVTEHHHHHRRYYH